MLIDQQQTNVIRQISNIRYIVTKFLTHNPIVCCLNESKSNRKSLIKIHHNNNSKNIVTTYRAVSSFWRSTNSSCAPKGSCRLSARKNVRARTKECLADWLCRNAMETKCSYWVQYGARLYCEWYPKGNPYWTVLSAPNRMAHDYVTPVLHPNAVNCKLPHTKTHPICTARRIYCRRYRVYWVLATNKL